MRSKATLLVSSYGDLFSKRTPEGPKFSLIAKSGRPLKPERSKRRQRADLKADLMAASKTKIGKPLPERESETRTESFRDCQTRTKRTRRMVWNFNAKSNLNRTIKKLRGIY